MIEKSVITSTHHDKHLPAQQKERHNILPSDCNTYNILVLFTKYKLELILSRNM